ncbi:MAG TPA: multidrug effflux MFS transporter, partial [Geminicoccaceae bacterium]|nr:multidrug effflux MFS transporter [Geminicoccaceae bacterium]
MRPPNPTAEERPSAASVAPPHPSMLFLGLLVAVTALGPLSMQIFVPSLPAIQQGFAVTAGTAQLVLSLSLAAIAVATLGYGPLADRHGRRPVMIVGIVLFLIGSVVCTVAPSIEVLILGRILQAAGGAAGMVLGRAMVRDLYDRDESARVIAYLTMAMVVAPMMAPAIGGVLNDLIGWRANFAFVAAVGLAVAALVLVRLPETRPGSRGDTAFAMLRGFVCLLRTPTFCGYAFQAAFSIATFMTFIAGSPYVMVRVFERPATEYGLWFITISASFMVGNFVAARNTRRVGLDRMIVLGSLVALLGTLAGVGLVAAGIWSPAALFLPAMVFAFANGFAIPNAQAGAVSVDPSIAGAASGLSGFLQMAISAVAAQVIGALQDGTPYPLALQMTAMAALALAAIAVPVWLNRRRA